MSLEEKKRIASNFLSYALRDFGRQVDVADLAQDFEALNFIFELYGFPECHSFTEISLELQERGCTDIEAGAEDLFFSNLWCFFENFVQFVVLHIDFGGSNGKSGFLNFERDIYLSLEDNRPLKPVDELRMMLRRVFSDTAASSLNEDVNFGQILSHLKIYTSVDFENLGEASDLAIKYEEYFLFNYFAESGQLDAEKAIEIAKIRCVIGIKQESNKCLETAVKMKKELQNYGNADTGSLKSMEDIYEICDVADEEMQFDSFRDLKLNFAEHYMAAEFEAIKADVMQIEHYIEIPDIAIMHDLWVNLLERHNDFIFRHSERMGVAIAISSIETAIQTVITSNSVELCMLDESSPEYTEIAGFLINNIAHREKQRAMEELLIIFEQLISRLQGTIVEFQLPNVYLDERKEIKSLQATMTSFVNEKTIQTDDQFTNVLAVFYLQLMKTIFQIKLPPTVLKESADSLLTNKALEDCCSFNSENATNFLLLKDEAKAFAQPDKQAELLKSEYEQKAFGLFEQLNSQTKRLTNVLIGRNEHGFSSASLQDEIRNIFISNKHIPLSLAELSAFFSDPDKCIYWNTKMLEIEAFRGLEYNQSSINDEIVELEEKWHDMMKCGAVDPKSKLRPGHLILINTINESMSEGMLDQQISSSEMLEVTKELAEEFWDIYQECERVLQESRDLCEENENALLKCENRELLYIVVNRLEGQFEILCPRDVNSMEDASFLEDIRRLASLLFCEFLESGSVGPTLYVVASSLFIELEIAWNKETEELEWLIHKFQKALAASGICHEAWNIVSSLKAAADLFISEFQEITSLVNAETHLDTFINTSRTAYSETLVSGLSESKRIHDEILALYEPVRYGGEIFEFLLKLEERVWKHFEDDIGGQCLMERKYLDSRRSFVSSFEKCIKQFSVLHTDFGESEDEVEVYMLKYSEINEDIDQLFEEMENHGQKLEELRNDPNNIKFADLFKLYIELYSIDTLVESVQAGIIQYMQERVEEVDVYTLEERIDQLSEETLGEVNFKGFKACIESYNQDADLIFENENKICKLCKLVEFRISDWKKCFEAFCRQIHDEMDFARDDEKYQSSKDALLQQLENSTFGKREKTQCAELNYIFCFLDEYLLCKQKCTEDCLLRNEQFAEERRHLLSEFKENILNISNELLAVTKRGVELKDKYLMNPTPNELLELREIVEWHCFLEETLKILRDMSDNAKVTTLIRQTIKNFSFEQLELPEPIGIDTELKEIAANVMELEELTRNPLIIPANAVLESFLFEDVLFEYQCELGLSETSEAHIKKCNLLREREYSIFGMEDVPVNYLSRITAFNLYCERIHVALSESLHGNEIQKLIIELDQSEQIQNMVALDVEVSEFCQSFDKRCKQEIHELLKGHACFETLSHDEFVRRKECCIAFGAPGYPESLIEVMQKFSRSIESQRTDSQTMELRGEKVEIETLASCEAMLLECDSIISNIIALNNTRWGQDTIQICESRILQLSSNIIEIMTSLLEVQESASCDRVRQKTISSCQSMLDLAKLLDAEVSDEEETRGMTNNMSASLFCEHFVNLVHTCFLAFEGVFADVHIVAITGIYKQQYDKIVSLVEEYSEQAKNISFGTHLAIDEQKVQQLCIKTLDAITEISVTYSANSASIVKTIIEETLRYDPLVKLKDSIRHFADLQQKLLTDVDERLPEMLNMVNSPLLLEHVHYSVLDAVYDLFLSANCTAKTLKQLIIAYQQTMRRVEDAEGFIDSIKSIKAHHDARLKSCCDTGAARQAYERASENITQISQNNIPELQEELHSYCRLMEAMKDNLINMFGSHLDQVTFEIEDSKLGNFDIYDIMVKCQNAATEFGIDVEHSNNFREPEIRIPDRELIRHTKPLYTCLSTIICVANCYAASCSSVDGEEQFESLASEEEYLFPNHSFCMSLANLHKTITKSQPNIRTRVIDKYIENWENCQHLSTEEQSMTNLSECDVIYFVEQLKLLKEANNGDYAIQLEELTHIEEEFKDFIAKFDNWPSDSFEPHKLIKIENFVRDSVNTAIEMEGRRLELLELNKTHELEKDVEDAFCEQIVDTSGIQEEEEICKSDVGALHTYFVFITAHRAPEALIKLIPEKQSLPKELVDNIRNEAMKNSLQFVNLQLPHELRVDNGKSLKFELDKLGGIMNSIIQQCQEIQFSDNLVEYLHIAKLAVVEYLEELLKNCGYSGISDHELVLAVLSNTELALECESNIRSHIQSRHQLNEKVLSKYEEIEDATKILCGDVLAASLPLYYSGCYMDMCVESEFLEEEFNNLKDVFEPISEDNTKFESVVKQCNELASYLGEETGYLIPTVAFFEIQKSTLEYLHSGYEFIIERPCCCYKEIKENFTSKFERAATYKEHQLILKEVTHFVVKSCFMEEITESNQILGEDFLELDFLQPYDDNSNAGFLRKLHDEAAQKYNIIQKQMILEFSSESSIGNEADLYVIAEFLEQQCFELENEVTTISSPCELTHLLESVQEIRTSALRFNTIVSLIVSLGFDGSLTTLNGYASPNIEQHILFDALSEEMGFLESFVIQNQKVFSVVKACRDRMRELRTVLDYSEEYLSHIETATSIFMAESAELAYFNALSDIITGIAVAAASPNLDNNLSESEKTAEHDTTIRDIVEKSVLTEHLKFITDAAAEFIEIASTKLQSEPISEYLHLACMISRARCHSLLQLQARGKMHGVTPLANAIYKLAHNANLAFLEPARDNTGEFEDFGTWKEEFLALGTQFTEASEVASKDLLELHNSVNNCTKPLEALYHVELEAACVHRCLELIESQLLLFHESQYAIEVFYVASSRMLGDLRRITGNALIDDELSNNVDSMEREFSEYIESNIGVEKKISPDLLKKACEDRWRKFVVEIMPGLLPGVFTGSFIELKGLFSQEEFLLYKSIVQ